MEGTDANQYKGEGGRETNLKVQLLLTGTAFSLMNILTSAVKITVIRLFVLFYLFTLLKHSDTSNKSKEKKSNI